MKKTRRLGLADALFDRVQQRVLGLLFGQPGRRFQSAELIRLARGGTGAVHRQLERLVDVGLVTASRTGNQKFYEAHRESPVFAELHGLVVKTVAVVEPLRRALSFDEDEIQAAFVYGSVATGADDVRSDIDLMVISDTLHHADIFLVLDGAEQELGRPVNPTLVTLDEWHQKRSTPDSFIARVAETARIYVIGSEDALA